LGAHVKNDSLYYIETKNIPKTCMFFPFTPVLERNIMMGFTEDGWMNSEGVKTMKHNQPS